MTTGRWPGGHSAAVSITMDNMGEAAELYRGAWPADKTVGLHDSVTSLLPGMLKTLEETGVLATYFIEGWNTTTYPQAMQAVRHSGHEVAFHGWQHEPWGTLDPGTEKELIDRSLNGFSRLSLQIWGFRPPGGVLTESSPTMLRDAGIRYCSPAGSDAAIRDDLVYLPFAWQGIDAYSYSDNFAGLREQKGDDPAAIAPAAFADRVQQHLDEVIDRGGYTALLFHPFLTIDEDRTSAMREIIERVVNDDRIWCERCFEVSEWVRSNPEHFGTDPGFDLTSWSR